MEVRKGWVEVGAIWQQPSSTTAPSPAAHAGSGDLGQSPKVYREERDVDFTVVLDAIRDLAARQCPAGQPGQSSQVYREERDVDFTVVLDAIRDLAARQCPAGQPSYVPIPQEWV